MIAQLGRDFYDQTTLHPVGAAAIAVLALAQIVVPRRLAAVPFLVVVCFVAPAQRVVVAGLDFNFVRILVVAGWLRVLLRGEVGGLTLHPLDLAVLVWAVVRASAYTVLHGTGAAAVYALGTAFDVLGLYFLFRVLVRRWTDLDRIALALAVLAIPVAASFAVEKATGRNLFAFFGGVPEITLERQGRLRAQGAFPHPILAGVFWAGALPLLLALWWRGSGLRLAAAVGSATALAIVVMSASSTPVAAVILVALGMALFPFRAAVPLLRWGVVLGLVVLHFAMKAPVWHLLARIDLAGGSTGWHRYFLIDQTVRRFGEWWLVGTPSTAHWGWQLFDVTNQYVLEAVRGGIASLLLFVLVLALAFREVGRLWRRLDRERALRTGAWCLGVSLFVHAVVFLAVAISYSQQNLVLWLLVTAAVPSLAGAVGVRAAAARRRPRAVAVPAAGGAR